MLNLNVNDCTACRWSHERRASYRKKIAYIEARQSELERARVPSPVRKARKESVRFVVPPPLDSNHPESDQDGGPSPGAPLLVRPDVEPAAFPFEIPLPAAVAAASGGGLRKSAALDAAWGSGGVSGAAAVTMMLRPGGAGGGAGKFSLSQWNALVAFWEHDVFVRSRYCGLVVSFAALVICVVCLASDDWSNFECEYISS